MVKPTPTKIYRRISDWLPLLLLDRKGPSYLRRWVLTLGRGYSPLSDELPWFTFPAVDWLESYLKPNMHVFEWGSGGSTLYFARACQDVVSIEHNPQWFRLVQNALIEKGISNVEYLHITSCERHQNKTTEDIYISTSDKKDYSSYAAIIDSYPDGHFNVISVDGRGRRGCVLHALPKVACGGILILDNSERYLDVFNWLDSGWNVLHFRGPVGYEKTGWFSQTSICVKAPSSN